MELLRLLHDVWRDPAPQSRVMRKSQLLSFAGAVWLIGYRHAYLQLGSGEPILVTVGLVFVLIAGVGVIGGAISAGVYDILLRRTRPIARVDGSLARTAEWIMAALAPMFVCVWYVIQRGPQ